jgi:hypothetical protein
MGVIVGGWEYVQAAYAVSGAAFVLYALSVHLRYRAERARGSGGSNGSDQPRD